MANAPELPDLTAPDHAAVDAGARDRLHRTSGRSSPCAPVGGGPTCSRACVRCTPTPRRGRDACSSWPRTAFAARPAELKSLDLRRSLEPDWFQRPDVVGYAAYTERFAEDGRAGRCRRPTSTTYATSGCRYLHLMPLLEPRPHPATAGTPSPTTAGCDPTSARSTTCARSPTVSGRRAISLCLDLVLNHVAREHEWAQAARAGDEHYRRYFHVFDDRTLPDAYEQTLPEVFPDFAPGSFTWDDELDGWVWTTFNSFQWDLDWSNPDVLCEMADVVLFLAGLGVEVLRLDAIAFLWKRMGTELPEPARGALDHPGPARRHSDRLSRSSSQGRGHRRAARPRSRTWDRAITTARSATSRTTTASWSRCGRCSPPARSVSPRTRCRPSPPSPSTTAWITYVRCHDDIGWAIDDGDAAAMGLSGHGAPPVPLRLLLRTLPRLVRRGPRLPGEPRDRRPAHQRQHRQPGGPRTEPCRRTIPARWTTPSGACCWLTPSCSAGAGSR